MSPPGKAASVLAPGCGTGHELDAYFQPNPTAKVTGLTSRQECWRNWSGNSRAGKAAVEQQERIEAGASGGDLDVQFSLPALSKSAFTHHLQAGGGIAFGNRALSEGRPQDAQPALWRG